LKDLKHVPDAHKHYITEYIKEVSEKLYNNKDPKLVFKNRLGEPIPRGFFLIKNEGNARENISGIVYGEYQGIAYIPFFLTKTQNMGLGSELLRQLEKIFIEKQSSNLCTMVFFSTPNQVNMYYNRGFSRLDQPTRLIGFSQQGKQIIQKIQNNSSLLQLFPDEDVVILYKMCSEICFTKFISTFGFNVDFMTTEEKTHISCFEEPINQLDCR
jgi:hypothetical protein